MKILVTGAAGFIGMHVSQILLARGDMVVGLDNLNDYYDPTLKEARLAQLTPHAGFRFAKLDVADRAGIADLFAAERFDRVVHLAAQAGVRYSLENPRAYVDSNVTGFVNLLEACRNYPGLSNARRITFEYVMLKGINDSIADAKALVRLLSGIPAKINLIPFNPWPGSRYECSDWDQIEKFSEHIFNAGYSSPVRTPRGRDILAACGQLKSETEKLSARERMALRAMAMTE